MYQDSSENKAKRFVMKKMGIAYQDSTSIPASTGDQAKTVDGLLASLESLESDSAIILKIFDTLVAQGQRPDITRSEPIQRFYKSIQKTITELKKVDLGKIPRKDVTDMESYYNSLKGIYDSLEDKFQTFGQALTPGNDLATLQQLLQDATDDANTYSPAQLRDIIDYKGAPLPRGIAIESYKADIRTDIKKEQDKLKNKQVLQSPEDLLMKPFKILLDTLKDAFLRYNAGLSGKVNRITDDSIKLGLGRKSRVSAFMKSPPMKRSLL
jgi:hypothetical protein